MPNSRVVVPMLNVMKEDVLDAAYPNILIFPFGEMVCFTTILPNLNKPQLGKKTGVEP